MDARKYRSLLILFLIAVLFTSLINARVVRADGELPTEPPVPTEVETESPLEGTAVPIEETPIPEETTVLPATEEPTQVPEEVTETPVANVLSEVPEDTGVVVLDENGDPVPLVSQEAAEIVEMIDPMWCPAGVSPGDSGCSSSYGTIAELLTNMRENPSFYDEAGTIYFTASAGSNLVLTSDLGSLGAAYDTLKNYELTLQGGWSGSTASPSFSGQTDFANNRITIGTELNPWVGNLTLNDLAFSGVNTRAVTIYTTGGDITLDNVSITGHLASYVAALDSESGDITVQNSTFAGDPGAQSRGFYASTGGSISISNTSFTGAGTRNGRGYHGATLDAPVVTLSNVTASDNDGSGVFVTGSRLIIIDGTFANNQRYGIEVGNPAATTLYIQADPACTGNANGCYNDTTVFDNTVPVITPIVNGVEEVRGWYGSDVSVSWSVADVESGILSSNCPPATLTTETAGTVLLCSTTNNAGLSNSASVTIRIDKSAPVITPVVSGPVEVNGWYGGDVLVNWSITDAESGILSSNCPSVSLTTETAGTTLTCSVTNNAGLSASGSITIKIDKSGPILSSSDRTVEATGPGGAAISYVVSAVDAIDGPAPVSCSHVSGSIFPLGSTTVTCSTSDLRGNTSSTSFLITVKDSTAPRIEALADIAASTHHRSGGSVFYPSPATSDIVDGPGIATCSPASGSLFPIGDTRVTCSATDAHGNRAISTFVVHMEHEKTLPIPTEAPDDVPIIIIPKTGGDLIDLDYSSAFWAFGVKLSFIHLAEQQTTIHEVKTENLPAELPDGFSLVAGIRVDVLTNGKLLKELPRDATLQLDFPMAGEADDQFAILYWNGSEWITISERDGNDQLPQTFSITIDKPGIYILVKK